WRSPSERSGRLQQHKLPKQSGIATPRELNFSTSIRARQAICYGKLTGSIIVVATAITTATIAVAITAAAPTTAIATIAAQRDTTTVGDTGIHTAGMTVTDTGIHTDEEQTILTERCPMNSQMLRPYEMASATRKARKQLRVFL